MDKAWRRDGGIVSLSMLGDGPLRQAARNGQDWVLHYALNNTCAYCWRHGAYGGIESTVQRIDTRAGRLQSSAFVSNTKRSNTQHACKVPKKENIECKYPHPEEAKT